MTREIVNTCEVLVEFVSDAAEDVGVWRYLIWRDRIDGILVSRGNCKTDGGILVSMSTHAILPLAVGAQQGRQEVCGRGDDHKDWRVRSGGR